MPVRLVVLPGDALEADVKAGKTFFRDSKAAEKTGTMPTKAIVAGAETYEEGYHAGDAGGLSAIDTDLAVGNIKKDVTIFGKVGTVKDSAALAAEATVAMMQTWAAIGTMLNPEQINDGNTGNEASANAVGMYVEIPFGDLVKITQWRQFGHTSNGTSDRYKIQYWSVITNAWVDWVTDITPRNTADWSDWASNSEVITTKIKVIITTYVAIIRLPEIEVKY